MKRLIKWFTFIRIEKIKALIHAGRAIFKSTKKQIKE